MGVYAVTGGSSGIGAAVVELLRKDGHEVINIDLKNGDICSNLATVEGRQAAIDGLYERCPDGLDGIVCNAGVSGSCGNYELVISLNYFGTVKLARGVYELLKKKHGSVVVTVSNTISQGTGRMDIVDLLNNVGDEKRIRSIVSTLDTTNQTVGQSMYMATKYALARWVRRISASWAANGVRVNAVAPGNVRTAMTDSLSDAAKYAGSSAARHTARLLRGGGRVHRELGRALCLRAAKCRAGADAAGGRDAHAPRMCRAALPALHALPTGRPGKLPLGQLSPV